MTTRRTSASVTTDRPARYGKQLISHFSRKIEAEWDEQARTGWAQFGDGRADLVAGERSLDLTVEVEESADAEALGRLEDVVGLHLVRFATHDALDVRWQRADGTQGTHQVTQAAEEAGPDS